ncbi:MAG: FIST C-terminal domain-containing protein [Spirochaetales bacterium]|nr:FIST C-terminal domain-containing protein [Spirochaetales bacterium]
MNSFSFTSIKNLFDYTHEKNKEIHIIFSNYKNIIEIGKNATPNMVLCSTSGEFTNHGFSENAITGFSCRSDIADVIELFHTPSKGYLKLKNAAKKISGNPNSFVLLLCDGMSQKEEMILASLFCIDDNSKIIGGSAGDSLEFKETYIYIGKRRVFSAAIFFRMEQRTILVKENIYKPTGKYLNVSSCNYSARTVNSFNDLPATVEFANLLGVNQDDLPNHFMDHPIGQRIGSELFIASPQKVNEDNSITFYRRIRSSVQMELLQPEDPFASLKNTMKTITFKPSFIFSIHCVLRSLKFKQSDLWSRYSSDLLELTKNQCGFISYGEQYYKHHLNQTMVLLAVE